MPITPHSSQIIDVKELADGALSIMVRCCNDPKTDSTLTIYNLHQIDTAEIQRQANGHKSNVEQKHLAKQRAQAAIAALLQNP
jgi:hypothetical protein